MTENAISEHAARYVSGFRDAEPQLWCWFLLNSGSRACIKERGHDEGVHEGPSVKACPSTLNHNEHLWMEKHQCEGVSDGSP